MTLFLQTQLRLFILAFERFSVLLKSDSEDRENDDEELHLNPLQVHGMFPSLASC